MIDLLVIGAGPAGCAAAIHAAQQGLNVRIVDRSRHTRRNNGESLHPGAGVLFEQLGVLPAVTEASGSRFDGHRIVRCGEAADTVLYGEDDHGTWLGFQLERSVLRETLIERVNTLGVKASFGHAAGAPNRRTDGCVRGTVDTPARFVIDASGPGGWARRQLGLRSAHASPRLIADYGVCRVPEPVRPTFVSSPNGWWWMTTIRPGTAHWTRVEFGPRNTPILPPQPLSSMPPIHRARSVDVTWRHTLASAGPGYLVAGDAAMTTDPSVGHGVIRALMTGIAAAEEAMRVMRRECSEMDAALRYGEWTANWFRHDVDRTADLYNNIRKEKR